MYTSELLQSGKLLPYLQLLDKHEINVLGTNTLAYYAGNEWQRKRAL